MRHARVTRCRWSRAIFLCALLLLALGKETLAQTPKLLPAPTTPPASSTQRAIQAQISSISEDQSSLILATEKKDGSGRESQAVVVAVKALQTRLKDFRAGDVVRVELSQEGALVSLREIAAAESVSVGRYDRLIALGLGAGVLLILALVFLRGNILGLFLGKDGRYSNSKFQMAMWFGIVITTYIALFWLRWYKGGGYVGGVNLAQNVLLLSGMSALTFGAAKGITTAKIQAREEKEVAKGVPPAQAALVAEAAVKPPAAPNQRGIFANLVQDDDGKPDLGDFQMVVVTLLAFAAYLLQVYEFLGSVPKLKVVTLPDVDATILATFGLGQGAYLTKKYASSGRE